MSDSNKEACGVIETSSSDSENEKGMQNPKRAHQSSDDDAMSTENASAGGAKKLEELEADILGVSPTASIIGSSFSDSGVGAAAPLSRKTSSSSDSAINELNKAASVLDACNLESGKLLVFQKYFHEPKMQFFVRPEGRRRHNAERQTGGQRIERNLSPPKREKSDPQPPAEPLRPLLNQAGAVVGYPPRFGQQLVLTESSEIVYERIPDPEHSIGSASTVPIEEVYVGNFEKRTQDVRNERTATMTALSDIVLSSDEMISIPSLSRTDSNSLSNMKLSPALESDSPAPETGHAEPPRRRKLSVYQPPAELTSFEQDAGLSRVHDPSIRKLSLELKGNTAGLAKRKTSDSALSKQSIAGSSECHLQTLSRESSVELEAFMAAKQSNEGERNEHSNESSESPPKPDITSQISSGLELLSLERENVDAELTPADFEITPTDTREFAVETTEDVPSEVEITSETDTSPEVSRKSPRKELD